MPTVLGPLLVAATGLLAILLLNPTSEGRVPVLAPQLQEEATVIFAGDAFFDRSIRTTMEEKGGDFIFSCIENMLSSADIAVVNLEGPITDNVSVSVGSAVGSPDNFRFTFSPEVAGLLYRNNIKLVNLGNNHITNFGEGGVETTLRYLKLAGVEYFGEPWSYSVAYKTINNIPLAFIGYNEFGGDSWTTISNIKTASALGYLPIVYAHWGAEYETDAPLYIEKLAKEFVDAGARLIIGSHPHVVEESEIYNGVPIYYSLGNFIFDQYFSEEVRKGLLVKITFTKGGVIQMEEFETYLERDRRTCLAL